MALICDAANSPSSSELRPPNAVVVMLAIWVADRPLSWVLAKAPSTVVESALIWLVESAVTCDDVRPAN